MSDAELRRATGLAVELVTTLFPVADPAKLKRHAHGAAAAYLARTGDDLVRHLDGVAEALRVPASKDTSLET